MTISQLSFDAQSFSDAVVGNNPPVVSSSHAHRDRVMLDLARVLAVHGGSAQANASRQILIDLSVQRGTRTTQ